MKATVTSLMTRLEPITKRIFPALTLIAAGMLIGTMYVRPNKRVIAVMVAVILSGLAWRFDMVWGLGVLVLTVPYPRGTVFGTSNVALILVLLVIWLLRITQRQALPPRRSPVDLPIAGLLIAFIVSMYNVQGEPNTGLALQNMQILIACVFMFYLIVGNVRTERTLRRFHYFQTLSLLTIMLLAVYELNHPGQDFIPGWISFKNTMGDEFNLKNVRVGGPFFDYELLAEFSAINMLLILFLLARARSRARQALFGSILLLTTFILFATVTRGAIISLTIALGYMLWIVRRRVKFVPLVIGLTAAVSLFVAMNYYVADFTRSGDLLSRLEGTTFVGLVPDSRQSAWRDGWERFLQHPIIGHGPYYSLQTGTRSWFWPHNGYLYIANLVGIVGISFYIWLLFRLILLTRPRVDSMRHPEYSRAYLIVGHLQLVLFAIDQVKIDFMRNKIYQFEVWIMFAGITSAYLIAQEQRARAAAHGAEPGPWPARAGAA